MPSEPFRVLDQRQHLRAFHFQPGIPSPGAQIRVGRGINSCLHFLKQQGYVVIHALYALILTQICSHKTIVAKSPHKCACS